MLGEKKPIDRGIKRFYVGGLGVNNRNDCGLFFLCAKAVRVAARQGDRKIRTRREYYQCLSRASKNESWVQVHGRPRRRRRG